MNGTVVICGTFDLYHAGHASALKYAKSFGDHLIALLYDDAFSETLKGVTPINPLNFRKAVLESVKYVDRVIVIARDLLYVVHELKPSVLIDNSDGNTDGACVNVKEVVEQHDGRSVTCPIITSITGKPLSSSYIRRRIYKQAGLENNE